MRLYYVIIVDNFLLVNDNLQLIIWNLLSSIQKGDCMTEQMIVDAAKEFKKSVKDELFKRDMTQRDLAKAIGVTEASLSLAINTFAVNKSSREVRESVRKLLGISEM